MKIKNLKKDIKKNLPAVFTGLNIISTGVAVGTSIYGTIKAMKKIDKLQLGKEKNLTKLEVLKAVWPYYIPAAVSTASAIGCALASNHESQKRILALGTALDLTSASYQAYKDRAKNILGEKEADKLEKEIVKERVQTIKPEEVPLDLTYQNGGLMPCHDLVTGKWFYTSDEMINQAVIKENKSWVSTQWVPLSDLYDDWGAYDSKGELFDRIGFNNFVSISKKHDELADGTKIIVIWYDVDVRRDTYGDLDWR